MTPREFATRAVGIPWRRDAASWQSTNCYGLIVLYFRDVLGVELPMFEELELAPGFAVARGWSECDPLPGATCWMAWRDGAPLHCGVLLSSTEVIHSDGHETHAGSVRVTSLRLMQRIHNDIRFYRYDPC